MPKVAQPAREAVAWHALSPLEAVDRAAGRLDGLRIEEAARRLASAGPNRIDLAAGPPWIARLLRQVLSPLVLVLVAAALLALVMRKPFDVWVILGVIAINTAVGFLLENRAATALAALREISQPLARLLRGGDPIQVAAAEVVPGDVLLLQAGDRVAADARLLEAYDLQVAQDELTGESEPVPKDTAAVSPSTPLAERSDLVYQGTSVTAGRGSAIVFATGATTEVGRIALAIAGGEPSTPLQRRLVRLSRGLGAAAVASVALVLLLAFWRRLPFWELLQTALDLGVAVVPEGLPIVLSVLLAVGVHRMARRHALVRRLPAVEALGGATVICADKTGTLTRNAMVASRLFASGRSFELEDRGYAPHGSVTEAGRPVSVEGLARLRWLGRCAHLCNDAVLEREGDRWRALGDPTEAALQALAGKLGRTEDWRRIQEIPFGHERRWMATLNEAPDGELVAFVKGAPDVLLRGTEAGPAPDPSYGRAVATLARVPLRVLVLGLVRHIDHPGSFSADLVEGGTLELLGVVGIADPPRSGAASAIARCRSAGVRVIMVTGDLPATAEAVARQIGLVRGAGDRLVSGPELDDMSDSQVGEALRGAAVIARATPAHKLRIVSSLRREGELVAVTGDGVNDAPALARADVGIAMGKSGTEVAKAASDIVLADDDFATIVAAIEEGRTISSNFRRVLEYLITTSAGSALTMAAAVAFGLPLPVRAVQLLWLNLVTDGLFDKTLALEPAEPGVMDRPPRRPSAPILSAPAALRLLASGALMAAGTLAAFAWDLGRGVAVAHARTLAFTTLVAFQWFSAFANRSTERTLAELPGNPWMVGALILAMGLQGAALYAPPLQRLLGTGPLTPGELGRGLVLASSLLFLSEAAKWLRRIRRSRAEARQGRRRLLARRIGAARSS